MCYYHWLVGETFCGLTFNWNYEAGYVDMEMPGYVPNALNGLQHTPKLSPQYSPHYQTGFKYFTPGTWKYETAPDETPTLYKQDTTLVQYILGSFFYYSRSLHSTILPDPNKTSMQQYKQKKPTK